MKKSFLTWNLQASIIRYSFLLLCDFISFFTIIAFFLSLAKCVEPSSFSYYFDLNIAPEILITIFTISRSLLLLLRTYLIVKIKKALFFKIHTDFIKANSDFTKANITTLVARDLQLLLDFTAQIHFPLYGLSILSLIIFIFIGTDIEINLMFFASLAIFIPISVLIGNKSSKYAKLIYKFSKERIENASFYLKYRKYLHNWSCTEKPLNKIKDITQKEVQAHNLDSWWRSLDLYCIVFGRGIPSLCVLIAALIFNQTYQFNLLEIWLTLPCIALILESGRFFADFTRAQQAFLHYNYILDLKKSEKDYIVLDECWSIWEGTLADNCLDEIGLNSTLYEELRLEKELANSNNLNVKFIQLQHGGINISHGQKLRILIIRAINLAIAENKPLYITLPLTGLDSDICYKLQKIISEKYNKISITFSKENLIFLQNQSLIEKEIILEKQVIEESSSNIEVIKNDQEVITQAIAPKLNWIIFKALPLFLIPAIVLNLYPIILESQTTPIVKILLFIVLMLSGIMIASSFGYYTEKSIRQIASESFFSLIMHIPLVDFTDAKQRISKDFNNVLERITWYLHDISWYAALLCCALFSIIWAFKITGIIIVASISIIFLSYYNFCSPILQKARQNMINQTNNALNTLINLNTFGSYYIPYLQYKEQKLIADGFNFYKNGHIRHYINRDISSQLVIFLMSSLIIVVCLLKNHFLEYNDKLGIILNSLILAESVIVLFFQALIGLRAQSISWERIYLSDDEKTCKIQKIPKIIVNEKNIIAPKCVNPTLSLHYDCLTLPISKIVTLIGDSGSGKTSYLKTIAAFNYEEVSDKYVLYLDKDAKDILYYTDHKISVLKYLKKEINNKHYKLIILDEVFASYSISEALDIIRSLEKLLLKTVITIIVVDHRFTLENHFSIPILTTNNSKFYDSDISRAPVMVS